MSFQVTGISVPHKKKTSSKSFTKDFEEAMEDFDESFKQSSRTKTTKERWQSAISAAARNPMVIAQIDLYQYKEEEVDVEIKSNKIYVKGRHVTERENGFDASEFERFYTIPEGVDVKKITTRYTDGMLRIEAPRPKREAQPRKIAGGEIISDDDKFEIVLDVSQYRPEEVEVKVSGDELIINGKQETEEKGRCITRQFTRNFKIPRDVDVKTLKSRVGKDGFLYVNAKKDASFDEERVLNIWVGGRKSPTIKKSQAYFCGSDTE